LKVMVSTGILAFLKRLCMSRVPFATWEADGAIGLPNVAHALVADRAGAIAVLVS
jgi:hypothetical protein